MGKMLLIICAVALTGVFAEPPVGRQYLPPGQQPSSQYGAPSSGGFGGGAGGPSTQYGAPAPGRFGAGGSLSNQYGAPNSGRFGGAGGLSRQYGAPASGQFGRASGLSRQYGAPASGRFGGAGGLSTQYGAPSSGRFGGAGGLSAQYGAPASGGFGGAGGFGGTSGFGGVGGLSTRYGAPGFGRAGGVGSQYAPGGGYNYGRGGYNSEEDSLSEPANYEFSYEVDDPASGSEFGHQESRQDENAKGSYHVLLPDGRRQIVEYEADLEGYKPQIRYEETGAGGYPASRGVGGPY